jgi:hypothetical protein
LQFDAGWLADNNHRFPFCGFDVLLYYYSLCVTINSHTSLNRAISRNWILDGVMELFTNKSGYCCWVHYLAFDLPDRYLVKRTRLLTILVTGYLSLASFLLLCGPIDSLLYLLQWFCRKITLPELLISFMIAFYLSSAKEIKSVQF